MKKSVVLALSGGIDSALAAILLKNKGFEVIGLTLKLYNENELETAEYIAKKLNIKWILLDVKKDFNKKIIDYFFESYIKGKTPNPCVVCNRQVKFHYLFEIMKEIDAEFIATGHYTTTGYIDNTKLIAASDTQKDQSYFLSFLTKEQIEPLIFPLAQIKSKKETESIIKEYGITIPQKESFEVCFIKTDYRDALKKRYPQQKNGYFILNGKKMGKHSGIFNYTVGQRRGIKIPFTEALYVKKINPESGDIILTTKNGICKRFVEATIENMPLRLPKIFKAHAKLRSKMSLSACNVKINKHSFVLEFETPQFAPTPGQIATVYLNNCIVLSGFIKEGF